MSRKLAARERLFVALDVASVDRARVLVSALGDAVSCYKVGLELLFGGGLEFAQGLKAAGKTVFLDMKLLDIENTVAKAAANIASLGLDYLTIHGTDTKTLAAAVRGRGTSKLKLLAVTVLTNLERADLEQQGIRDMAPADLVMHRARLAKAAGVDGIVASGQEAALVRAEVGPDVLIVTPGIRLAGGAAGDQARVMTPGRAIAAGADCLVVGRPITEAADPRAAAKTFIADIDAALKG
jgi:orotidine-5'-phosphate decarboxylase